MSHIKKFLKFHQLNIIKIINKDYKEKVLEDIKVFLKMKKRKKQQYGCEQYKNIPQDGKQKRVEHKKNVTK